MRETGVVIDQDGTAIYWHTPERRSSVLLPDSRELWDVLWDGRHTIQGFAHSHPGSGLPTPSRTDLTTFVAIEKGLGRQLSWWIASEDSLVLCRRDCTAITGYSVTELSVVPGWLTTLRSLSEQPCPHKQAIGEHQSKETIHDELQPSRR